MFSRNQTCDAEWAQDDANFGDAPGAGGGNQFPADADERGHVTYRLPNEAADPGAGNANYHEHLQQAIDGLYDDDEDSSDEEDRDAEEEEDRAQEWWSPAINMKKTAMTKQKMTTLQCSLVDWILQTMVVEAVVAVVAEAMGVAVVVEAVVAMVKEAVVKAVVVKKELLLTMPVLCYRIL
jgi:hypothetical protein